jgi:succinate-acetate transporter protein
VSVSGSERAGTVGVSLRRGAGKAGSVLAPPSAEGRIPSTVFLRPIGSPLPLGFLGLAVASLVLGSFELGWLPVAEQHQLAIVLIAFAFPLQAVATIFGFLSRDAVVASGIGVQAASWLTTGLLMLTSRPGSRSELLAFFLFAAAAALLSAVLVAAQSKLVPALVMGGTAARFVLSGAYEHTGSAALRHAAGWEGVVLAGLAIYAALALDLESARRRTVLPLGRFGLGRRAIDGPAAAQVDRVQNEAGVREQL